MDISSMRVDLAIGLGILLLLIFALVLFRTNRRRREEQRSIRMHFREPERESSD